MDVGPAADPRRHVEDRRLPVAIEAGLQAERADDPGRVARPGRVDEPLAEPEDLLEDRLADREAPVPDHGVLRDPRRLGHLELLGRREADEPVERALPPLVDAEELEAVRRAGRAGEKKKLKLKTGPRT